MSVLFRGIEYPKTCSDCPMHDVDDDYCRALGEYVSKGKPMWCPAEEVKVPHGRLIDGDELKTAFPRCDNNMDIKVASARATINHMPTIVEAEGAEE